MTDVDVGVLPERLRPREAETELRVPAPLVELIEEANRFVFMTAAASL